MDYKRVIEDFNNGTIDTEKWQVVLDNDSGYWNCLDESLDDNQRCTARKKMEENYGRPSGYEDIVDILNAAGVTSDWC